MDGRTRVTFFEQVFDVILGNEEEFGNRIGQNTIDLFGDGAIESEHSRWSCTWLTTLRTSRT